MKFLEKFKLSKIKTSVLALAMAFVLTMLSPAFVQASAYTKNKGDHKTTVTTTISQTSTPNDFEGVAKYIHTYKKLPSNFITKKQAKKLGWVASKGNLAKVAPGKSIGGDVYTNREKTLPTKKGRVWHECDINYVSGFRNSDRILYSNDGLIYKTTDHYKHFTQMY